MEQNHQHIGPLVPFTVFASTKAFFAFQLLHFPSRASVDPRSNSAETAADTSTSSSAFPSFDFHQIILKTNNTRPREHNIHHCSNLDVLLLPFPCRLQLIINDYNKTVKNK
jgi:hypothetical protein